MSRPHQTVLSQGTPGIIAAPAGGPFGGRGCALILTLVMGLGFSASKAVSAEPIGVPSGLTVTFFDRIDEGPAQRFRFVAPEITTGGKQFGDVVDDMAYLCDQFALPALMTQGVEPAQVVVTLMERPVEFGTMDPAVTQFFESYSVQDGLCIWEVF